MNALSHLDYWVFGFYFLVVSSYGYWVYRRKKNTSASATQDYFLAEGSLTWWAIGASLIASNISAEQFIGMSGSGFKMGLAIASYEWMAAASLLVVAVFFLPVYLRNKIYTMPQFLERRYNSTVSLIMAVFWLLLYVLVNLTSILYLGAIAISAISGLHLWWCMLLLSVFAIAITLGGMKVIGFTDVVQVFFLVLGGLVTTYLAINMVAEHFGGSSWWSGWTLLQAKADDHLHMILPQNHIGYSDLPGLTVLVGGLWIANLNYWGCNQYITQRALGADLKTARNGLLFAAGLKMLMPLIVVLPGIAAYVLYQDGLFQTEMLQGGELNPDRAYPVLLNLLPAGLKGLSFAALTAAVVASLAGKANSIATIFTLDIYQKKIAPQASPTQLVKVGKWTIVVAMVAAAAVAPWMGIDKKGGFQYIQEYTGFVSPGIFAMFVLGFFWKKASTRAALFATIGGFFFSVLLKFLPQWVDLSFLVPSGFAFVNSAGIAEIPFLDRMGFVFLACVTGMVLISGWDARRGVVAKGLEPAHGEGKLHPVFWVGLLLISGLIAALYTVFY